MQVNPLTVLRAALLVVLATAGPIVCHAGDRAPEFPLKVSDNGRYFVDRAGQPFLYQADSAWFLFHKLTFDEVALYLDNRRARGFTVVQVQLLPEIPDLKNCVGHGALLDPERLDRPDDSFFERAEYIVEMAAQRGMLVNIAPAWLGCCEGGWRDAMLTNGPAKCRELGRYIGSRFAGHPNVMWTLGGDHDPGEFRLVVTGLAEGIRDSAPKQLMTAHAGAPDSAAEAYKGEAWLNVNSTYTYAPEVTSVGRPQFHVYAAAAADWARTPVRPFILVESAYENERNSKPQWIRRQAYWSLLSGAAGFAYGEGSTYFFQAGWQQALNAPGVIQMSKLKALFSGIAWQTLAPDRRHRWVIAGYGTFFDVADKQENHILGSEYVTTSAAPDGSLMVSYLPAGGTLTVQLNQFTRTIKARWFDPVSGNFRPAANRDLLNAGTRDFESPGKNAGGDNDWVLLLETKTR